MIHEETNTTMEEHRSRIEALRLVNSLSNYKFEPFECLDGWRCRFWSIFDECTETGNSLDGYQTDIARHSGPEAQRDAVASVRKLIRAEMEESQEAYDNF